MPNEIINKLIINLWNRNFSENADKVYSPLFYGEFKKGSLLFVGCNPSFRKDALKRFLRNTEHKEVDLDVFFKWKNISSNLENIEKVIAMDSNSLEKYKNYFGCLHKIASKINLPWEHIDLFLYRQTSQSDFASLVWNNKKLTDFGTEQVEIFKDALDNIQPKIIVVINALASEIIRGYFKDRISNLDKNLGFHWFSFKDKKVPIFFSSMLTGQRALDRWSLERLVWHIEQATKHID